MNPLDMEEPFVAQAAGLEHGFGPVSQGSAKPSLDRYIDALLRARDEFSGNVAIEHLAEKFAWVEGLPEDDHMARLRVRGVDDHPERLEELVAEIGMGRALLEG